MTGEAGKAVTPGALNGVRILDFTHALAGPYATMILSDLGADVLKVENPGGGDRTRRFTTKHDEVDFSPYFGSVNRGKQSILLDLKNPAGRALAHRLAMEADVVVQNMGPGVAERLGLGYEELSAMNARLIYAMVTGYGREGSWVNKRGVDPAIQALSGSMSITGEQGRPPVRVGYSIVDLAGGVYLAMGILAALQERERSGKGQLLDISLLEAQMALMENAFVRYLDSGEIPERMGSSHTYEVLTRAYPTKDGWMVAGITARNWPIACKLWGREEWARGIDMETCSLGEKTALIPQIEAVLKGKTTVEWVDSLDPAGVPCIPVNNIAEAAELPPVKERNFIQETVDANGRRLRIVGSPIRLSRTPGMVRSAAPLLGQHTRAALSEWLNMNEDEYASLEKQGIFRQVPRQLKGFW